MNTHTLHLPKDLIENLGQDFLDDDTPLEVVFDTEDAEILKFLRIARSGERPPLDLAARLMERGIDVDALEASVTP